MVDEIVLENQANLDETLELFLIRCQKYWQQLVQKVDPKLLVPQD